MSSLFKFGQVLKGKVGTYTISKQLYETIWLATSKKQNVIIKSASSFRIKNERDVIKHFQSKTDGLRRLIDEIEEPSDPPIIALEHLDDDLLEASSSKRLLKPEIKHISKRILEALNVLHKDGYVHTDIKLDNILVNYGQGNQRFTDVRLADCESTVHVDSVHCKERQAIGAPYYRSPEAQLGLQWGPSTDIWSLGTVIISLLWGDNFFIFRPDVPPDDDEYILEILMKYHQFFGPYPPSYADIADNETLAVLSYVMDNFPAEKRKPFSRASGREISKEDREFLLKIMKLDPRDRPTAQQLLEDEWFDN